MADVTSLTPPSPGLSATLLPNKSVEPNSPKGPENVKITTLYRCMGRLLNSEDVSCLKKIRKVLIVPQTEAAANPCHQEEEKKAKNNNTCKINKQKHEQHIG